MGRGRDLRRMARAALIALAAAAAASDAVRSDDASPPGGGLSDLLRELRHDLHERREAATSALILRARGLDVRDRGAVEAAALRALERERAAAVRGGLYAILGRTGGDGARDTLMEALLVEREPGPAEALADALGDLATERVAGRLSELLFSGAPVPARCTAAAALGRLAGEAPLRTLLALAGTTHPWAVQAAVLEALGRRRTPEAVEALLARMGDPDSAVHAAARTSLEALLGADAGDDPAAWRALWESLRGRWPPAPGEGKADADAVSGAAVRPEVRTTARFFGIPVTGRRVAFVLDCSQSMWGEKMETARRALVDAVKGLRPGRRFGVVLFHEKVWTLGEDLDTATPARKWLLAEALADPPTRSYTNIHDALERAFAWTGRGRLARDGAQGLDEIFLLSDGEPNRGRRRDADGILEAVAEWNPGSPVRLHAVALGDRPADLLRRLAAAHGGEFVRR